MLSTNTNEWVLAQMGEGRRTPHDIERMAQWLKSLRVGGLRECRKLVLAAVNQEAAR